MQCPGCQTDNPPAARFCMNCGAALSLLCSNCQAELPAEARFCMGCGQPVSGDVAPPRFAVPTSGGDKGGELEGERRWATVILADVKGSTALAERVDTETWVEIMNRVFRVLDAEIYRYGGEIDQYRGDGLVAFFGVRTAHEDDPERAVLAALAMQDAIRRYAAELAEREGADTERPIELLLRVGVNTGEVIAATVGERRHHREDTAMGRAIALAARMESAAEPGTVLVSENTYRLVDRLFEWQSLGEIAVKGVGEPVAVYRPLAHKGIADKGRGIEGLSSPLVGREIEFEALQQAIERLSSGIGGVVTVVGEAGIGKSRLVAEIRKSANQQISKSTNQQIGKPQLATRNPQWIEGRCLSYATGIAYQLWQDMLRGLLGVAPDVPPAALREALARWVQASCPACYDDVYPYLGRLLSLPLGAELAAVLRGLGAQGLRAFTFRAVETLIRSAARRRPLVIVCEDLHWADPTSLELLERLLALTDRVPVLFICVFRPEMEHGCWRIVEAATRLYRHRHTGLWLEPLSEVESETLVGNLLRVEDLPQRLRERILSHAEGSPFFVEEIVRSLIDEGIIAHDETTSCWRATRHIRDIPIPRTLHGALAARIDRLEEETRHVLQLASVVGRIFSYGVLSAIVNGDGQDDGLEAHLVALQREQMIRERARVPEREYIFKHELTREAAYNGLLRRESRTYHRRVAEALERLYPDRVEEQLGLLAHHWERAEEQEKAIVYLLRAGDQARLAYANEEAIDYYQRALALLRGPHLSPPQKGWRLEAQRGLGQVYFGMGMFAEAEEHLREAIALGRELGLAPRELVQLYFWLGEALYWQSRYDERIRVGEEGLALLGDDTESVEAALMNQTIAIGHWYKGNTDSFYALTERTAGFIRRLSYVEELRPAYTHIATMHASRKDIAQAMEWMEALRERGARCHDLRGVRDAHYSAECALRMAGDLRGAISWCQQALELSSQMGDLPHESWCLISLASDWLQLGDLREAKRYLDRGFGTTLKLGEARELAVAYYATGRLLFCQGRVEEARDAFQEAGERLQKSALGFGMGWLTGYLGRAHLARGDREAALRRFQEALALATPGELMGRSPISLTDAGATTTRLVAGALSGLEEAYEDPEAFRDFCDRCRAQAGDGSFVQWYLEPAEPRELPRHLLHEQHLLHDAFATSLASGWVWQDPFGDCRLVVHEGLEIDAANGRDLQHANLSAPRVLRAACGDWAIQTACAPASGDEPATETRPAMGGLLLWKDKESYLCLVRGVTGKCDILFSGCVENHEVLIGRGRLSLNVSGWVFLRLERAGDQVSAFCSADGEQWFTVGHVTFPVEDPVQVGVHAIGNIDRTIYHGAYPDGTAIRFESFQLWAT